VGEVTLVPAEGGAESILGEFSGMTQGNLKVPPRHLGWTPDSRYLMIAGRESPEGPLRLFRVDSKDGTRVPVMEPQSGILGDSGPAVSPDGKTLAFHRFRAMGSGGIYTVGLDEAYLARGAVRTLVSGNFAASPVWLNNRELAFYGYRLGEMQIFRVPADGSSEAVPILGGLQGMELSYSIAQQRLAFKRNDVDDDIWRLPLQGDGVAAGPAAAWILSSRQEAVPEYSPDETLVAFISNRAGYPNVWICERNGSHPRQLTRLAGSITGPMSWSPDGKWITFASNAEGSGDVYVIAADGTAGPRRLTQDPPDDVRASWSKDGKWIYFGSNRTGRYEVWKIAPEGGQAVQVTTTGGSSPLESPDGRWLYYAGDDQYETVLWRRPAAGGATEKVVERLNLWYSVGRSAIYYFGRKGKEVRYWDAVTRQDRLLAEMPAGTGLGITAAPDGRELAISPTNSRGGGILMIERFR